jgi:hypothetical protein
MKHTCASRVFCALSIATALVGCRYNRGESDGPTDNFRALDANRDDAVDRYEWENVQGSAFPESLGFRYADCDSDGRVTWHEYFVGYLHMQHCRGTYLYDSVGVVSDESAATSGAEATHEDDALGEDWRNGPLVVRADEQVQIYAAPPPEETDVPTHMRRRLPPLPGRYSENDLSATALQRVKLSSRPVADTLLVSHYDPREKIPGNQVRMAFPRVVCEINNGNADLRITMVDLQIVWRVHGHEYHSRLLKTLWANPSSAQTLHVWFGSPIDAAECRLLHVRGQPVA